MTLRTCFRCGKTSHSLLLVARYPHPSEIRDWAHGRDRSRCFEAGKQRMEAPTPTELEEHERAFRSYVQQARAELVLGQLHAQVLARSDSERLECVRVFARVEKQLEELEQTVCASIHRPRLESSS